MIVFYTPSTLHLATMVPFEQGSYLSEQFNDGEYYLKITSIVQGKKVWVVTATNPPAEHSMQLFLLLDALKRQGAQINLLITYFGYARQDVALPQEASSSHVVANILKIFALHKIVIIHAHSKRVHDYLECTNVYPLALIAPVAQAYDIIVAPDHGARELVQLVATHGKKMPLFLTKVRLEHDQVLVDVFDSDVRSKKILIIDDIIATGNTVTHVANALHAKGAERIAVWATHGIFSGNAVQAISNSCISKVYVTNTVVQNNDASCIEVVSIASMIIKIIADNE